MSWYIIFVNSGMFNQIALDDKFKCLLSSAGKELMFIFVLFIFSSFSLPSFLLSFSFVQPTGCCICGLYFPVEFKENQRWTTKQLQREKIFEWSSLFLFWKNMNQDLVWRMFHHLFDYLLFVLTLKEHQCK